ncbi:zinc finger bed domain-containing protein 1-like [Gigaspora margarita]|uniref:Zinc finger bed domain-containing protein 1-like n=1 Tax=Gigaspora margarita TaxID=4874 RepID=A0A8H4EJ73_GIGMA|nr:zinc finger bed domain-containing protein 1-like [Gigaspora margarita]
MNLYGIFLFIHQIVVNIYEIKKIIETIGSEKFSAITTDAGSNIQNARQLISAKFPNILNLCYILHAINLISKDICNIPFANQILTKCAALKEEIRKFNIIEPLENLRYNSPEILSQAVISILRSHAFFDDVRVLVFILGPVKKAITILESCLYNLADCFCKLIHLGASINKLSLSDHSTFHKQCIAIFNKRYNEFADLLYLLCFFLHPQYNDSFPKNKDYLVQLALKLFSIVPHAAGCERVWSRLGWLYGLRRNRLALHKIENMHKLASYYYSHAKHELLYFGIEKTNTEVFDILVDEYLNLDEDDFVEIDEVDLNESEEDTNLSEETDLLLNNILNLNRFEDEFEDDDISMDEDYYDENREETSSTNQLQEDIDWDPIEEVDKIIENI